ncbi:hypothetical protein LJR234_004606 [Mesorhizobium amorphae]|uniref:hypothetical protein n=1 Tax=Mesorhizobium amorphae TaxID=71433 RepID=UPI003ECF8FB0
MSINPHVGSFALDCWTSAHSRDDPKTVYADNPDELRAEALKILRSEERRYLVLYRWHAIKKDWIEVEELTPDVLNPPTRRA